MNTQVVDDFDFVFNCQKEEENLQCSDNRITGLKDSLDWTPKISFISRSIMSGIAV